MTMRLSTRVIGIAFLLGIGGGVASGAPTAKNTGSVARKRARHLCEKEPDEKKCLEPFYIDDCGKKWRSVCKPFVEKHMEAHYNANPSPKVKMLKPNAHDIPVGLRDGKTNEYTGPKNKRAMAGTFTRLGTTKVAPRKTAKPTIAPVPKAAKRPALNDSALVGKLATARGGAAKLGIGKVNDGMRVLTSDNLFARTGLTRPPHSGLGHLPVDAHRAPAWDSNGARVKSCEEYAYEKVYDWARYTDAVAACSGDRNCQLDIAFLPTTPGIADRTLLAKDGTPTATQIKVTGSKKLPKNDFFVAGSKFVLAGGGDKPFLDKTPDLEALAAALEAGKEHYELGGAKYPTEWEFHRKLHDANRTLTDAEFEEYELRKAKFRELLHKWSWAAAAEEAKLKGNWKAAVKWVNPIDMVTNNPFERYTMMQSRVRNLSKGATSLRKKGLVDANGFLTAKGKTALAKYSAKSERAVVKSTRVGKASKSAAKKSARPAAKSTTPGAKSTTRGAKSTRPAAKSTAPAAKSTAPAAKSTAPAAKSTTPGAKSTTPKAGGASPRGGINKLPGATGAIAPTALMGFVPKGKTPPSSSQAGKGGQTGAEAKVKLCDPKNFGAVMEMLGRGPLSCQLGQMLREEWNRKKKGYKSCLDLDDDDCDWSPMMFEARFTEGVPYIEEQQAHEAYCMDWTNDLIDQPTLAQATSFIDGKKAELEKVLKKLKPYQVEPTSNQKFGKEWVDADHFGDKDMFAAGYDYDLGWDIAVAKAQPGAVCEVGVGARGGFGVDGWFIGGQFEVVDGRAQVDWNRKGDKSGQLDIHLRVFSYDVFDPIHEPSFQGSFERPLFTNSVQIPQGYKPSFTVMAGPVPITGAVWGEFFYGAKFGMKAVSESSSCDMSKLKFGVDTAFTPELGLNAKAQVGVGISGLLSAGVRGMVNLVTVGVPVTTRFAVENKQVEGGLEASLGFDLDVRLSLATLSGWLAVYVELLFFEEEFVLFRWNGVGPESISLLGEPLHTELPLFVMSK